MAVDGRLLANPNNAAVAGDVRANENLALTATQTLFAREHNRIVSLLPTSLSAEDRFQIARRIVVAEQQYITYNEFLPAMGVVLPAVHRLQPVGELGRHATSLRPSGTARTARSTASSRPRRRRRDTRPRNWTRSGRRASRSSSTATTWRSRSR